MIFVCLRTHGINRIIRVVLVTRFGPDYLILVSPVRDKIFNVARKYHSYTVVASQYIGTSTANGGLLFVERGIALAREPLDFPHGTGTARRARALLVRTQK